MIYKVKIIAQLEYELADYSVIVQYTSQTVTRILDKMLVYVELTGDSLIITSMYV